MRTVAALRADRATFLHGLARVVCAKSPGQAVEDLERYGKVRHSTAGRLRSLGFALLPTLDAPHFDVLLPDLEAGTLDRLELGFDPPVLMGFLGRPRRGVRRLDA